MHSIRAQSINVLTDFTRTGLNRLAHHDPILFDLMSQEYHRQQSTLSMVASSSIADPLVLACEASVLGNVTTEGYPGQRYHGGCEFVDGIESLALERAKTAFGACYANVQPHSGSSANQIILFSVLKPGDRLLGFDLDAGGHLTHGARASISGQYFESLAYGLDADGLINYTQVRDLALRYHPKLIICGASAYPRTINFALFREIADEVGAILLADISHIAGLVAAGCHPSPIDHAHFTTTSTYKQLFGPRGGLILSGRDHDQRLPGHTRTLSEMTQRAVFPIMQGTPILSAIAAKAGALAQVMTPQFRELAQSIMSNAQAIADGFIDLGYHVLTGGTDNHMVLIDVSRLGLTGAIAESALEECSIIVNKNRILNDQYSPLVTSGVRLGTNGLALRGMNSAAMGRCVELIDTVLSSLEVQGKTKYRLDSSRVVEVRREVERLCARYPIPYYPTTQQSTHIAELQDTCSN